MHEVPERGGSEPGFSVGSPGFRGFAGVPWEVHRCSVGTIGATLTSLQRFVCPRHKDAAGLCSFYCFGPAAPVRHWKTSLREGTSRLARPKPSRLVWA